MQPDDFLYEAERAIHMMRYPTRLTDPQGYYDYVVGTKFFQNRWHPVLRRKVSVKRSNHAAAWADMTNNVIYLPPWACSDFTLLHEISHFCVPREEHGINFRAAEVELVKRFMGAEVGRSLHYAMLAFGLEH